MAIAGVLFDKDGTFVDFDRTWGPATFEVIRRLAREDAGIMQAQAAAMHFSLDTRRFLPTSPLIAGSSASYGVIWGKALGRTDLIALKAEIDAITAEESMAALQPIGQPAAVMAQLRREGFRLGVATNDSEASARRQVKALGLDIYVEFVAGYDSGHEGKPAPGMVHAFARHLRVAPSELAMVGDSVHDLHCARAAGALAIGVLSGPASAAELAPHADAIIEDISQLSGWLARAAALGMPARQPCP